MVVAGYASKVKRTSVAAELRLLEMKDHRDELLRAVIRLRSAAVDILEHPCSEANARMRHVIEQSRRVAP